MYMCIMSLYADSNSSIIAWLIFLLSNEKIYLKFPTQKLSTNRLCRPIINECSNKEVKRFRSFYWNDSCQVRTHIYIAFLRKCDNHKTALNIVSSQYGCQTSTCIRSMSLEYQCKLPLKIYLYWWSNIRTCTCTYTIEKGDWND